MQVESGRLRVVAPSERRDEPANEPDPVVEDVPSPGRYLRDQRLRRGVSIEQLAASTKIPRRSLLLLEEDRYDELPGPVFAKGFLRCCARALEVDGDAVMELLYERERAALQARRKPAGLTADVDAVQVSHPRPVTGSRPAASPSESALHRMASTLPSPTTLLWVVVAALVTMVLMAAFNMLGHGGVGPTS